MFGKNKARVDAGGKHDSTTLISSDTSISGNISFTGAVHIEGRVKGDISADQGLLTIAHSGSVEGDIRAQRVVIDGHVRGNVVAEEHLELASRAVINGNVYYNVIEMTRGSQVNGSLEHHPNGFADARPLLENGEESEVAGEVIDAASS